MLSSYWTNMCGSLTNAMHHRVYLGSVFLPLMQATICRARAPMSDGKGRAAASPSSNLANRTSSPFRALALASTTGMMQRWRKAPPCVKSAVHAEVWRGRGRVWWCTAFQTRDPCDLRGRSGFSAMDCVQQYVPECSARQHPHTPWRELLPLRMLKETPLACPRIVTGALPSPETTM